MSLRIHPAIPQALNDRILYDLNYTEDDKASLRRIMQMNFFGMLMAFGEDERQTYATAEGIAHQINNFRGSSGLIFWLVRINGTWDVNKASIQT